MNNDISFILSLSIVLATLIGLLRFKKIEKAYQPFLFYVFASLANEVLIFCLPLNPMKYRLEDLNIFTLFEYFFLLLQFFKWKIFQRYTWLFYALLLLYILVWFIENIFISSVTNYNLYHILLHSFTMVLLSINVVNQVAVNSFDPLYKNAKFIICIGLIIFFIYNLILNALFLISANKEISKSVFSIRVYINLLSNLLFAAGVYFMPERNKADKFF